MYNIYTHTHTGKHNFRELTRGFKFYETRGHQSHDKMRLGGNVTWPLCVCVCVNFFTVGPILCCSERERKKVKWEDWLFVVVVVVVLRSIYFIAKI